VEAMFLQQIEKLTDVLQFLIEQISNDEAAGLDKTLLSSCSTKLSDLVRNLDIDQSDNRDSTLHIDYFPSEDGNFKREAEEEDFEDDYDYEDEDKDDNEDITENHEDEDNLNEEYKNHSSERCSLKTPIKIKIKIKNEKKEGSIYRCMMCEEDFEELDDLENHDLENHMVDGKFKCKEECDFNAEKCDFNTEEKRSLVEHFAVVHKELDVYRCPECEEIFFGIRALGIHRRKYHRLDLPKWTCPICLITFSSQRKFSNHCKFEHRSAQKCNYCDKTFKCIAMKKNHVNFVHKKSSLTCHICGDKRKTENSLEIHIMKHRNAEKTIKCEVCDKYFYTDYERKQHSKSHNKDKYLCSQCDYTCAGRDGLKRHLKTVHSDERNFTCGTCGLAFKTLEVLKGHEVTHTGIRNYECDICGKKFKKSTYLNTHKRIHTATYAESCQLCGKHFVQMGNYRNHMLKHHSN